MLRALIRAVVSIIVFTLAISIFANNATSAIKSEYPALFQSILVPVRIEEYLAFLSIAYNNAIIQISGASGPSVSSFRQSFSVATAVLVLGLLYIFARFIFPKRAIRNHAHLRDPLFENKLIALLLFVALIGLAPPILDQKITHFQETHMTREPTNAPVTEALDTTARREAILSADLAAGERRARICLSCHSVDEGAPQKIGPNLWGVVGRDIAGVPGFSYSPALEAKNGAWTLIELDLYLQNTQAYAPGGAMVQRFPDDERRAEIIVYLNSLQ